MTTIHSALDRIPLLSRPYELLLWSKAIVCEADFGNKRMHRKKFLTVLLTVSDRRYPATHTSNIVMMAIMMSQGTSMPLLSYEHRGKGSVKTMTSCPRLGTERVWESADEERAGGQAGPRLQ